jgi:signal transduction histidine kinase
LAGILATVGDQFGIGSRASWLAAAALLLLFWRRSSLLARWLCVALLLSHAAADVHVWLTTRLWPQQAPQELARTVAEAETRARRFVESLETEAGRAAALEPAAGALRGDRDALTRLFAALERQQAGREDSLALAVHSRDLETLAWSGRVVELASFRHLLKLRKDVFVVEGTLSTTLIAAQPVLGGRGETLGLATAEMTLATRRNIQNEFLRDYDRLVGQHPDLEVRYFDLRDRGTEEHPFSPLPPEVQSRQLTVRSRAGTVLATMRATAPRLERLLDRERAIYRGIAYALALALVAAWTCEPEPRRRRLAAGFTAMRLLLLFAADPFVHASSGLFAPELWAIGAATQAWLGPALALLRSPLDLLLTTLWLAALAYLLADFAVRRRAGPAGLARALAVDALACVAVAIVLSSFGEIVQAASVDIEAVSLRPRSPVHLVLQWALLLLLGAAALLLLAWFSSAGEWRPREARLWLRLGGWLALAGAAYAYSGGSVSAPLLVPAALLFLGPALLGATRQIWLPKLLDSPMEAKAGAALVLVAAFGLLLYPGLVHFGSERTRAAIEGRHAREVLRQPEWRGYVLREAQRKIDEMGILETTLPGPHPPEIEELAYSVWSATDLATLGFSSAVEIQDASGFVVSRFASNLPSLGDARRPLPRSSDWELFRERSTVASAERLVLHARRLLVYEGDIHGAVHVYVGDDYWNLPFLTGRDPYAVLYRPTPRGADAGRPLDMLVWDKASVNVFSSAERPPSLPPPLSQRLRASRTGLWSTLVVDGTPHHAYLFSDGPIVFAIVYPRHGLAHHLSDLVEAVLAIGVGALLVLFVVMLVRTLLRRSALSFDALFSGVRERFTLRLFVAFVAVAFLPVFILQNVVGGFVAERLRSDAEGQALELAAVAKKAVEDYALFQRDEDPGEKPVTDAVLVWVSSLIRNDLDVFARGRLLSSSKPELYASGLLSPRVAGSVFRALTLERQPWILRTENIGGFSYRVVSVPVRLDAPEPRILSIPLALRQRAVESVVEDLEQTIRLAAVLFLAIAAAFAHSMSRRISGPIRALTAATRRIARGDLAARVSASTQDELMRLVESFNKMAEDLERQRVDLERSNRLAAWAEMARQVAHEVKNPLTPIQLSAEHLRRVWRDPAVDFEKTLLTCTDTILKQVHNLREIATEFSSFARPPAPVLESVPLAPLLEQIARSYEPVLPKDVTLRLDVSREAPPVKADKRLIERALVNLVENALHAVGEAGQIVLRLRTPENGRVIVEVEDSGRGLDAETRSRAFEPFFSTKATGSGLGLALVKKIAEDHGGGVSLASEPGANTKATLWLPLS